MIRIVGYFLILILISVVPVWAQEKQACQDQLMISKATAYNLDQDRDKKEELLAKEQITSYMLRQKIAGLEKELEMLKKPGEPKAEEPPKP